MTNKNIFILIIVLSFLSLFIYLFVSAPIQIDATNNGVNKYKYSVEDAFRIIAKENDLSRTFYTKNIVGKGNRRGLKFDENWTKENVEAGPLPALFLRSTSNIIERSEVPLGLYLGSDYPISKANLFKGIQADKYIKMKQDTLPQFFYDDNSKRYTAMFPDFASAKACIKCHNEHEQSPKKNWKLNDIMGATTWTYPNDSLTTDELLDLIKIYRVGVNTTFDNYLTEVKNFKKRRIPKIGNRWPQHGYYLPSISVWQDTVNKLTSPKLIKSLFSPNEK